MTATKGIGMATERLETVAAARPAPEAGPTTGLAANPWLLCLRGIVWREVLRFLQQRGRFFAALVRPLVWLFIFAAVTPPTLPSRRPVPGGP